ncbi:WRC domain-containing protein [Cinnamomum micranthum f. kanehirae]|uniref:WRC domain-containing protein n=1 Tax=Cinnamomum micranthum f. kanehirae TaxID=337451 RepID=A0A3S3M8I9_9MAGN|nr:WRC domain-containing protein [Cinnamomum micranthum f. kanehirae]
MRIRKRPMVPFFPISPPPQTPPDLPQQYKDEILQKSPTPKQKLEEEEEKGEDHRAEAKERRSGTDPTTYHSKDPSNGWVPCEQMKKKKRCCMFSTPIPKQVEVEAMEVKGEQGEENEDDDKKSSRDLCSKRSWSMKCGSAEAGSRPSSSSRDEGARWQEGKSVFPFKKRKVHHQWAKETIIGKEKKMKTKLKRTMTPKKLGEEEEKEEGEEEEDQMEDDKSNVKKKWGSNGSVVMGGSRCSRVNGRGWRCCQQTLVGYSLCEHHLGKGRLRSMSSVRGCYSPTLDNNRDEGDYDDGLLSFPPKMMHEVEDNAVGDEKEEEEDDDEKLTSMVMNKRIKKKKSGILKARSISSLLGETHLAATLVPSNALV